MQSSVSLHRRTDLMPSLGIISHWFTLAIIVNLDLIIWMGYNTIPHEGSCTENITLPDAQRPWSWISGVDIVAAHDSDNSKGWKQIKLKFLCEFSWGCLVPDMQDTSYRWLPRFCVLPCCKPSRGECSYATNTYQRWSWKGIQIKDSLQSYAGSGSIFYTTSDATSIALLKRYSQAVAPPYFPNLVYCGCLPKRKKGADFGSGFHTQ